MWSVRQISMPLKPVKILFTLWQHTTVLPEGGEGRGESPLLESNLEIELLSRGPVGY